MIQKLIIGGSKDCDFVAKGVRYVCLVRINEIDSTLCSLKVLQQHRDETFALKNHYFENKKRQSEDCLFYIL